MFDDALLVAVAAWRPEHDPAMTKTFGTRAWRCEVLAVANGYKGEGRGLALKRRVVDLARRDGVLAVVSTVHWDNAGMLAVNERLGGTRQRIITGFGADPDWCWSVIVTTG